MEFKALEKCLHLIGYWVNEDEDSIKILLNKESDIIKDYCKPFYKEINSNLLEKETIEGKTDLIKYYLFEFYELLGFYKNKNYILGTGSLRNYSPTQYLHINKHGESRELNEFENYAVNSHQIFNILLNEIQLCCIKYNIDFFKICDQISFSLKRIDCGITLAFEKTKFNKVFLPLEKSSTDTSSIINNFDNVDIEVVYNHFKSNLVDTKYLSEQDLTSYIKLAFELKTLPKKRFVLSNPPIKLKIRRVFYKYFESIAGKPFGKQKTYASLLGDYFEGYNTDNVSTNFKK